MADERLWYLNLSDLGITDGKPIEVNESVDCEAIWNRYAPEFSVRVEEGTHDLTPPSLNQHIRNQLDVRKGDYHGDHVIRPMHPGIYINESRTRIPEDRPAVNFVFTLHPGEPGRIFYMLRWLTSPTRSIRITRREVVGARAGAQIDEPREAIHPPFTSPRPWQI